MINYNMEKQTIAGVKRTAERDDEQISRKRPRLENVRPPLSVLMKPAFCSLPEHVTLKLFQYVPIDSLGEMALASKKTSKQVLSYLVSDAFAQRVAQLLDNYEVDLQDVCKLIALAIKRATFLLPVTLRLKYFLEISDKLHIQIAAVEENHTEEDYAPVCMLKCTGEMLLTFVAGWADDECNKAFKELSNHYEITQAMARFTRAEPGEDVENEKFLRRHVRDLFLDACPTDAERATWIGFFSEHMCTAQLAKVLLLLYGPLNDQGNLHWTFPFDVRAFEIYTPVFVRLARIVGILHHIPNWSKHLSLEVLVYMSNTPNCWLLRSFASMLLPMNSYDNELVLEYFNILYKSDRTATASLLMALILMVSSHYIKYSRELLEEGMDSHEDEDFTNNLLLDSKCAFNFVKDIIRHPQFSKQYDAINKKLWDTVFELAKDFGDASVQEDDIERAAQSRQDFRSLMDAWKDYMVFAMID